MYLNEQLQETIQRESKYQIKKIIELITSMYLNEQLQEAIQRKFKYQIQKIMEWLTLESD